MSMNKFFVFIILFVGFSSCTSDFLNSQPDYAVPAHDLFQTPESYQTVLNGAYSLLLSHTYYGRNFFLISETFTDNAQLSSKNIGHFSSFYTWSLSPHTPEISDLWHTAYTIILSVNTILDHIDANEELIEHEKNRIKGEALCLRALVYYDLVRLFAPDYAINSDVQAANGKGGHAGVPLVLHSIDIDSAKLVKRHTVAEVFSSIISDALSADSLLRNQFFVSHTCNQLVAKSILSFVSLHVKDYNTAISYAEQVIQSRQLISNEQYNQLWGTYNSSEAIFYLHTQAPSPLGTNSIGHILLPEAYGGIIPSQSLLSLYTDTDMRNSFFKKRDETYCNKYPAINSTLGLNDIPILRTAELYFVLAEAYFYKSLIVPSFATLSQQYLQIIKNRATNSTEPITATGAELLHEIENEHRREFSFEGKRLFYIKRHLAAIERTNCGEATCVLPISQYSYVFPIPFSEIQTNFSIIQNYGY